MTPPVFMIPMFMVPFETFVNQFKPPNCVDSYTLNGHKYFVVEHRKVEIADWDSAFEMSDNVLYNKPAIDNYLPFKGISAGLKKISNGISLLTTAFFGAILNTEHEEVFVNINQFCSIKKLTITENFLSGCQRFQWAVLSILQIIRGLIEVASLGMLNILFAPIDILHKM